MKSPEAFFATKWDKILATTKPANGDVAAWAATDGLNASLVIRSSFAHARSRLRFASHVSRFCALFTSWPQVTFLPDNLSDIPPYADD